LKHYIKQPSLIKAIALVFTGGQKQELYYSGCAGIDINHEAILVPSRYAIALARC
jgi:hypothetical protein